MKRRGCQARSMTWSEAASEIARSAGGQGLQRDGLTTMPSIARRKQSSCQKGTPERAWPLHTIWPRTPLNDGFAPIQGASRKHRRFLCWKHTSGSGRGSQTRGGSSPLCSTPLRSVSWRGLRHESKGCGSRTFKYALLLPCQVPPRSRRIARIRSI